MGNGALALSCYHPPLANVETYRCAVVVETTQLPFDWQGRGAGSPIVGPGPVAVNDACDVSDFVVAGANDADASPAMATNSAKKRTTAFIFSNLMCLGMLGDISPGGKELYARFFNKSIYFNYILLFN